VILLFKKLILIIKSPRRNKKDREDWKNLPDDILVMKYKEHFDPEIIGILYERYLHLVLGISMKYLKNKEKAQDAVMDIFESLFEHLKVQNIRSFPAWLYGVSKNYCLMKLRTRKILTLSEAEINHSKKADFFVESDQDLHLYIEVETNLAKLEEALKCLHKDQEKCIRLFYLENKTYREVSKITGIEIKSVKSHLQNGKRNLKNILVENGKK